MREPLSIQKRPLVSSDSFFWYGAVYVWEGCKEQIHSSLLKREWEKSSMGGNGSTAG